MGVNWQRGELYTALKNQERTGLSLSEQNALANPYGNQSFGGLLLSQCLPQLLSGGMEFLAGKVGGGGSSKKVAEKVEEETVDPESLKKDIQTVLDKYKNQGITSVEDLEAYLRAQYKNTNSNIESLTNNISEQRESKDTLTKRNTEIDTRLGEINVLINSIYSQLGEIETQIIDSDSNSDSTNKQNKLQEQLGMLLFERNNLEDEKDNNCTEIQTLTESINSQEVSLKQFSDIQSDINKIKEFQQKLNKAEGKESASTLVNPERTEVATAIKNYKAAEASGNPQDMNEWKDKIKTALEKYVENSGNQNSPYIKCAKAILDSQKAS